MYTTHLLVRELFSFFIDVPLVQVCSKRHQPHLRQTKVSKLDMPKGCDEEIVRLEVPMDNSEGVKILDRKNSFSKIEPEIEF